MNFNFIICLALHQAGESCGNYGEKCGFAEQHFRCFSCVGEKVCFLFVCFALILGGGKQIYIGQKEADGFIFSKKD